jgi:hypothetical protein
MNDFEKFESELNELYTQYVLKFRVLSYLEKELDGHFRNQREKVQVNRCFIDEIYRRTVLFNLRKSHRRICIR